MIIGLTGPIAAGKNEVAKILKRQGAIIIEADEIGHELLVPQSPVWCEAVKAFGSKILNRGGVVNRHKLGEMVFEDKSALEKLNSIMHPRIKEELRTLLRTKDFGGQAQSIIINAALPVLFEGIVDTVWVVMASREKRLKRLIKQGSSKSGAQKRIKAQMPQAGYLKLADVVIKNEGTLAQLKKQVQAQLKSLKG